ncbi:MAG: amino acid permease, partial [bacterium]
AGFANWLSIALKSAFALVGIGALATILFPGMGTVGIKIAALLACLLFSALNTVSLKEAGKLQIALVLALLIIMALYSFKGFQALNPLHYSPFTTSGWQSVFAVAGMVFVSYGGLTKVISVSEEVRNPSRNLPLGMFLAFGIVSALYILVVFITVGLVDGQALSGSLIPLSLGAGISMKGWGIFLVDTGAFFAFATTANAGILSASRSPMAMSRDGLLPELFSQTNKRFGTPHIAIASTTVFITGVIAFLSVENLVKTASTMMILMFMLVNFSIIIMRYSGVQNYRPSFKAPFFPWLQIAAIIIYGFLIVEMGNIPLFLTGVFVIAALLWYLAYVNQRINRQSAFVYMVKNVIAKDIVRSGLEDELKKITIERDSISLDRFDSLVKQAEILDLEQSISARDMFRKVAEMLSARLGQKEESLYRMFLKREKESSTVIHPGLAIPHIIIEGNHIFDLLIIRCREGIIFSELNPPVTTAFVLVGSLDERNYHLRALMNIARIVEETDFEERWKGARGVEEVRDIIILSKRRRVRILS